MAQMIDRCADVGAHGLCSSVVQIVPQIRRQQALDRRPNQVDDRAQVPRLVLLRPLQLFQRRLDGAAVRMPEDDDQTRAELFGGKFDAADLRRRDDVAGDADHEQVPEPLIEDDLHRDSRIGTPEDTANGACPGRSQLPGDGRTAADVSRLRTSGTKCRLPSRRRASAACAETIDPGAQCRRVYGGNLSGPTARRAAVPKDAGRQNRAAFSSANAASKVMESTETAATRATPAATVRARQRERPANNEQQHEATIKYKVSSKKHLPTRGLAAAPARAARGCAPAILLGTAPICRSHGREARHSRRTVGPSDRAHASSRVSLRPQESAAFQTGLRPILGRPIESSSTAGIPGESTTQGCFDAKMWMSGGIRSGSSSVPTRTKV